MVRAMGDMLDGSGGWFGENPATMSGHAGVGQVEERSTSRCRSPSGPGIP